jgi:hypothetical protein
MLLLELLFCLVLILALSTYWAATKRWWGSHRYRVRIIRRDCWITLAVATAVWLAIYLPRHSPQGHSQQSATMAGPRAAPTLAVPNLEIAVPNALATPVWPAPNTPIPGLNTTIGFEEAKEAEDDAPARLRCGAERWPVKTLSDADAANVNLNPVPATITELAALPAPASLPADHRIAAVELTTYAVRARLIEFKRESDDDFHLVIAEPNDREKTMIAEIPAPGCSNAAGRLAPPRREFVDRAILAAVAPFAHISSPTPAADARSFGCACVSLVAGSHSHLASSSRGNMARSST